MILLSTIKKTVMSDSMEYDRQNDVSNLANRSEELEAILFEVWFYDQHHLTKNLTSAIDDEIIQKIMKTLGNKIIMHMVDKKPYYDWMKQFERKLSEVKHG